MIRIDKIQEEFLGEVGFKNPTLSGYNIVDANNQISRSGLKYEDASKVVSIRTIKETQEDPNITDVQFNEYLVDMQKSVSVEVCNRLLRGQGDFVAVENVFPFEKSFSKTEPIKDKFVGFELYKMNGKVISEVSWVELSFDSDVSFNLYLYNSNLPKSPIQTLSVEATAGESKIVDLNWIIADDATHKGGKFYLGYFMSDLGGAKPYEKEHDLASLQVNVRGYDVDSVEVDYDSTKINVEDIVYSSDTHGLNIGINVYIDYTEQLIMNKRLFARAMQLLMCEKVIDQILHSTRSNLYERLSKDLISRANVEYYGSKEMGIQSIDTKIDKEISDLKKTLFFSPKITRATLVR